jgi:ABC-type sugar transport system ATPase subunit
VDTGRAGQRPETAAHPRLSASGLTKSYGGVRVLDAVNFDVAAGEVHALVGENGAGKSTLIKILGGAVRPDAGNVRLDGTRLPQGDPRRVRQLGVSVVYQEFALVPSMSVADNLRLGQERGPWLRASDQMDRIGRNLRDLGVEVDPSRPVQELSVAHQQLVEIARALLTDARAVILDEPTAALSGPEIDRLLAVVRQLRAGGLAVLYVSHRLDEVFALADRITVLRDGRRVATVLAAEVDRRQVIRWMVGRDVSEEFPARQPRPGQTRLAVTHLSAPPRFYDVSLAVREGEIVGLAGLVGAGRTSAALAIVGALPATDGAITIDGHPTTCRSPSDALERGVAYITEDRQARGLFPWMSTGANLTIAHLPSMTRAGCLSPVRERAAASAAIQRFGIRAAGVTQPAGTLSGGNQQKVLLGRFLLPPCRILILDEPTRGVDVGARAEIYALMNRLTDDGLAILMISSDLTELVGMSDRIVVLRDGRTAGELPRSEASPEAVMSLATGA